MRRTAQLTLNDLHNKFGGGRCAILGNGPSLPADLWEVQHRVPSIPSVGVNRSWRVRQSIFHVALDPIHVEELREGLWTTGMFFTKPEHAMKLRHTSCIALNDPAPAAWPLRRHVPQAGPAAVQVALWLGMDEIILCGFDMRDGDGRKFYDHQARSTSFRRARKYMKRLRHWADERDVEMSCASKGSMLVEEEIMLVWKGGGG